MWTCPKCDRIFHKTTQPHSCQKIPLEQHFQNKILAKELFDHLLKQIEMKIGECRIVSLPCCVHLFGSYDFLAALPKKDRMEIRFALDHQLNTPRLKQAVPLSAHSVKNCVDITKAADIDTELLGWLDLSYHLKASL